MKPLAIPAEDLDAWLPQLEWHLAQFAADKTGTVEDYIEAIREKKSQLWIAFDGRVRAAVLTEIALDRLKTCKVTHGAGDGVKEWLHLFDVIKQWAIANKCKRLVVVARPGWEKMLKSYKLKKSHVVLEGSLDG